MQSGQNRQQTKQSQLPNTPTVDVLGFPIANLDMTEAVAAAAEMLAGGDRQRIVTANAEILYQGYADPELGELLRTADLLLPDGIGVVKAAAQLSRPVKARVAGADLLSELVAWAAANDRSVYLLGAAKESVEGTVAVLKTKHPALRIAGWHDGYFNEEEKEDILREIGEKRPDFLFIAMGFPAQDLFCRNNWLQLPPCVMMGVGGTFDAISGRVKRAPLWVQRLNLEWAYRFAQNPKRLGRFRALPGFMHAIRRQVREEKRRNKY